MTKGIKARDIRDFERHAKKLDEIIKRIRSYAPEAHIYVACDTMHLMSKSTLDCESKEKEQSYVVSDVCIEGMDCGDW